MSKRKFIFDGSNGTGAVLSSIVQHYAQAAYPLGGSDCAAASREALLEIARKVGGGDVSEIPKRQVRVLQAAVNWYYLDSGLVSDSESSQREFELLLTKLNKKRPLRKV